jgi:predicted DNA-binding protein with PD1-like motif/glutaredoxin
LIYPKTLQLEAGSDLLNSLQALAIKEVKFGYILSVVGNLSIARFQCPGKEQATIVENHLEIIALNGTISPNKCHLHISLSDGECKVWAGHLEEGTIILKGADILVGFLDEATNKKELNTNKQIVEIFILPDCPWSSRAVRMLRTLQIPHDIKVIENDNDFKSLNTRSNYSSFPQIFIDGKFIGGYSELAELHASGKLSN